MHIFVHPHAGLQSTYKVDV